MELREYFRIIIKSWWVILPLGGIGLVSALLFSYSQTPTYEATSTYVTTLGTGSADNPDTYIFAMDTLAGRVSISVTYCQILTSNLVRNQAFELAGFSPGTVDPTKYEVTCSNLPETNVLLLAVQGPSPDGVVRLSEAIASVGLVQANSTYSFFPLRQLDPTQLAEDPVAPKIPQNAVLGTALGLIVGVMASFLMVYLQSPMTRLEGQMIRHPQLGVYNERYFHERYTQEVSRANQRNRPMSIAMVVVTPGEGYDLFPEVAKIKLLRAVALDIQDIVQESNIVAYLGRMSFGILLPERTSDESLEILNKLHNTIRVNNFDADGYVTSFQTIAGLVGISGQEIHYREVLGLVIKALQMAEARGEPVYLTRLSPGPFDLESQPPSVSGQPGSPFGDASLDIGEDEFDTSWLLKDILPWEEGTPQGNRGSTALASEGDSTPTDKS
jgi:capsular polysaccharide biosynthesis protein